MYNKCAGEDEIKKDKFLESLGERLFNDLKEIEDETELDRMLFEFFDRCSILNTVLAKHGYFLKSFEGRDIYRFLKRKKDKVKMRSQEIFLLVSWKNLMDMK